MTCLSLFFFNGYFLFLLLTGILPRPGHGSETAEIPVSRAGWLVFLAPAGSTRHGNRQQLLVILQPISPIHKGLAKLDKFLKIFAPWWFIQTERASPRMHSSKAAGTGPRSCPTPLPGWWKRGSLAAGDASLWHGCRVSLQRWSVPHFTQQILYTLLQRPRPQKPAKLPQRR